MLVFKDLEFKERSFGGVGAHHAFDNGMEISVQASKINYCTPKEDLTSPDDFSTFEVAVIDDRGELVTKKFVPDHYDDVLGWQDRGEINALMLLIQNTEV
jgi:hypothetical protein